MALTKAEKALLKKMIGQLSDEDKASILGIEETKSKKSFGRANFQTGKRPNEFVNSEESDMHKADSKIDKILWKNKTPEVRSRISTVKATCTKCEKSAKVSIKLVYSADNKYFYVCDKCGK